MMGAVCLQVEGMDVSAMLGPGCYALWFSGEVVYIGKAKKLLSRLHTQRQILMATRKRGTPPKGGQRAIPFSSITIFPCEEDELDALELRLITKHRPRYNINLKPAHKTSLKEMGFDYSKVNSNVVTLVRRV